MRYEYALYKGDTFVDMGTADYLAKLLNVKRETIKWLASPTARKRRKKGEDSNALICVRIDMKELLEEI